MGRVEREPVGTRPDLGVGAVLMRPFRSPAAAEQTGNPSSQEPASQRPAAGSDVHSSSNYSV